MPRGSLPPSLEALARREGLAAADAVLSGDRPAPCRWDPDAGSITSARMARVWAEAFADRMGPVRDLPE